MRRTVTDRSVEKYATRRVGPTATEQQNTLAEQLGAAVSRGVGATEALEHPEQVPDHSAALGVDVGGMRLPGWCRLLGVLPR